MNAPWRLLTLVSVLSSAEPRCSPTSYYKNCWIRRFPGIYIDVEESLRRGAQLLKSYQEDTALKCSRTCCLTRNFSCNLAIFHFDVTHESVNCFHLHCPSLESCILSHRGNVVLYNITKGVDPDLLVFGKHFNTNVRVLPHHYSRPNASDPLPPDKRQFIHPRPRPVPPGPAPQRPSTEARATTRAPASARKPSDAATRTDLSHAATRGEPPNTAPGAEQSMAPTFALNTPHDVPLKMPTTTTITQAASKKMSSFQPASDKTDRHISHPTALTYPLFSTVKSPKPPEYPPASSTPPSATGLAASSSTPASGDTSKHSANDTKGGLGRNQSAVSEEDYGSGAGGGPWAELGPGWHVATHTVLVAVAICVTLLLGCCCSVVLVFSWRGHRKRMGRYRTAWRGKKGSMRLIKYVLVKEGS